MTQEFKLAALRGVKTRRSVRVPKRVHHLYNTRLHRLIIYLIPYSIAPPTRSRDSYTDAGTSTTASTNVVSWASSVTL